MGVRQTRRYNITRQWLIEHGCASDPIEEPVARLPVEIWVDPNCWLLRLSEIQLGFVIAVEIAARKGVVRIDEVEFLLRDAPDIRFELLPCPEQAHRTYCFPNGAFALEQDAVLNQAFPGPLRQSYPLEGILMGVSFRPLPDHFVGVMPAEITLRNEFGEVVGSERFKIAVGPKEHAKRDIGRQRQSVFEPLEDDVPPVPRERPVHRKPFRPVSDRRYLNRSLEIDK